MDSAGSDRPQQRTVLVGRELDRYKDEIASLSETRLAEEWLLKDFVAFFEQILFGMNRDILNILLYAELKIITNSSFGHVDSTHCFWDRTAHPLSMGKGLEKVPSTNVNFKTLGWLTAISGDTT